MRSGIQSPFGLRGFSGGRGGDSTPVGQVLSLMSGNAYSELWHPERSTVWTERSSPATVAGDGDLVGTVQGLNGVSNLIAISDAERSTLSEDAEQWAFTLSAKKLGETDGSGAWDSSTTLRIYMGVKTSDTLAILLNRGGNSSPFYGYISTAATALNASTYVDGTILSPQTQGALRTAITGSSEHMVEFRGLDATGSALDDLAFAAYTGTTFKFLGDIGPIVVIQESLVDAAAETTIRAMFQEWGTP